MNQRRIAIFASGNGSNAIRIIDYFRHNPDVEVAFLLSNREDAPVVDAARSKHVKVVVLTNSEVENGSCLTNLCKQERLDFIILAGFLRKIPVELIQAFPNKIVNVHPSLLPKFGGQGMYGKHVHEAVLLGGESESGITIHYVNEEFDKGEHIAQFRCFIDETETLESLQAKIHELEHAHFPKTIEKLML